MKVLVTGSTATQVGRPNRAGFVSAPVLLVQALRDQGHKVDWRPVTPGEDLKSYRRVISFLTPPLTFGSLHYYGALWALTHDKAVAAVDDWRFMTIVSQAASCDREKWRLWDSPPAENRKGEERKQARKHKKELERLNRLVTYGNESGPLTTGWPWPIAAPLFPWWDPGKFPLKSNHRSSGSERGVYAYDPTPLMPRPGEYDRFAKPTKAWLLASLSNHQAWLDKLRPTLKWPVQYLGGTAKLRKLGLAGETVQEDQLVREVYPRYTATLCPPYPHAGSGWWRARVPHAAWAGCVTVGFNGELAKAGEAFNVTPTTVEALTPGKLQALANEQAAVIRQQCKKARLNQAITDLISLN